MLSPAAGLILVSFYVLTSIIAIPIIAYLVSENIENTYLKYLAIAGVTLGGLCFTLGSSYAILEYLVDKEVQ